MSDLIQKAIDQTERAQYGVCCAEAVHALDVANERIAQLETEKTELERLVNNMSRTIISWDEHSATREERGVVNSFRAALHEPPEEGK